MPVPGFATVKRLAVALGAAAVSAAAAQAADDIRYVSITGNDAATCKSAAPCRTLQRGINKTPIGGELRILDSGDYGTGATIRQSLTVSGNGNTVYLGDPLVIQEADAVVVLRELTLDGQGTVVDGLRIVTARTVHIERCTIRGFTQEGIQAAFGPFALFVTDSTVRNNGKNGLLAAGIEDSSVSIDNSHFVHNGSFGGTGGGYGITLQVPHATISRSTISYNNSGLVAHNGTAVSIVGTVASHNKVGGGFNASNGSILVLESSTANANNHALSVSSGGFARISNSTFTRNKCCGVVNQGTVETRHNNTIRGNPQDFAGNALVQVAAQ